MLCVRVHGPNDVRVDEVAAPSCGAADAIVAVARCGICGTDLGYAAAGGVLGPTQTPLCLGHEISGRIIEVGKAVKGIATGMRVAVNPMAAMNLIGNGGPEGGFSEILRVRQATLGDTLHELPATLDDEAGALVEPLAVGMHAVNVGAPAAGEPVVVIGAGAIGLAIVAALRARGIDDVVIADLSAARLERAEQLGARTIDAGREDLIAALSRLHGSGSVFGQPVVGSRVFFDAAGAAAPLESMVRHAPFAARFIIAGVHKRDVALDLRSVLAKEIRIQGAIGYPQEFPAAIAALESGRIAIASMITHRFGLREFDAALATAADPQRAGKVVVEIA